ncbi:MAG: TetR/AcrR family transcriptional regulator [Ruminococcaceae bacterium]|nr:TetR/AcrR family transcriptional regulator [Oscillospiraceae bacterium]
MDKIYDKTREHLLVAGIQEIEKHGLSEFSLRRVASMCGVSCAAPYKHFKNKDEFVLEIIKYIGGRWKMLEAQVIKIFEKDKARQIEELSAAYIRFWIANPNFRSILLLNPRQMDAAQTQARKEIDSNLIALIEDYAEQDKEKRVYEILSLFYGALLLLESGQLENSEASLQLIKDSIRERL